MKTLAALLLALIVATSVRAEPVAVSTEAISADTGLIESSPSEVSPWERRAAQEAQWRDEGLALVPNQSNYFFPLAYNASPHSSSRNIAQYKEAKYQFSVKVLLWDYRRDRAGPHLYFGYTQLSFWQVYDRNRSAPFRDINHEPEVFLTVDSALDLGPATLRQWDAGAVHESNGVGEPDSRSWNRIYAQAHLDRGNTSLVLKPWIYIPDHASRDNNRDILKFMGYGEATLSFLMRNHVLSVMVRNNLRARHNRGAAEVNYSFPLTRILTGLIQIFNGYGESLLDYNRPNQRFSIGIALSEWR